ncbi:RNA-directed DNA methylation 4 isoform X2 [Euphorbia lathyris]|uniref:RNA-directed DNA methylation 4 isoform X2 n=1 Tax=Euphorbia lathyris TaxID=212925 RepID=UPI003313606B
MASVGESSSTSMEWTAEKPVVVRVKRKSFQSRLDAFWLEINERPSKRPLLDFQKLSIDGESTNEKVEDLKKRKVFVHHVETISSSEATIERLRSFVPGSADAIEGVSKIEEWKETVKKDCILAQNARFEQIRRIHGVSKEASHDKEVKEICRFYDVVRVDVEERSSVIQEKVISLEDQRMLSRYLPMLREFIPSAVDDIESDIHDYLSKTDEYVYDYYTVTDDMDLADEESLSPFPLVKVEEEDFYDGPDDESDYESEDSNAEAHPRNEYPDETSEEEEEEPEEDEKSGEVSNVSEEDEADEASSESSESNDLRHEFCEDEVFYEDCTYDCEDDINASYDDDDDEN